MADSALQRKNMVESQIRPSDITDRRITSAMSDIAREPFLPQGLDKTLAYMDGAIALGSGRAMLAPRTLAQLLQLAAIDADDKVLIVGAASGYSAAIAARMARSVTALEGDAALTAVATSTLAGLGNVTAVSGELTAGYAAGAPYDVILIDGAVDEVPEALIGQLGQGGRLVTIEAGAGIGRAIVLTKSAAAVSKRIAFDAAGPVLPGFARAKGFVF
jgi:protein-L-isoaspartate(D-aspartate) O-methyltransferase